MFGYINKRAQSTAEYVIVLGLIVAAVLAMQTYVKRGLQGRIQETVDFVGYAGQAGSGVVNFTGNQYEPYYLTSTFDTTRSSNETADLFTGGSLNRTTNEATERGGRQVIANTD